MSICAITLGSRSRPRFFAAYDTQSPAVLSSAVYRQALAPQTQWSRPAFRSFPDSARLAGALIADAGAAMGAIEAAWFANTRQALLEGQNAIRGQCALRAMGGEIQGKLYARDEEELRRGREAGYDFDRILTMDDLVSSEDVFFAATGITDGELLQGVRYFGNGATTDSLVVRGLTGTVRQITATHRLDKLDRLSVIQY